MPSRSATKAISTKSIMLTLVGVSRGRYFASINARMAQQAKAISTKILKKNALPVMNGKK
jgi:hypothetical protein